MIGSCFRHVSPSPASSAFSMAHQQRPAAVVGCFRPAAGRRTTTTRLQMLRRPAETPRLAIRAQNYRGGHVGDSDGGPLGSFNNLHKNIEKKTTHNFPKERLHIISHVKHLIRVYDGLLHYESGINTRCFCMLARNAVTVASDVVDSARLNNNPTPTPGDDEISSDTVRRTLGAYAQIFVQTVDDTLNNNVSKETVISFLGGLRGVVSVAHILLQAALDGLGQEHPKDSLSEYAFNYDVKKLHRVYHRQMYQLEYDIRNAPSSLLASEILMPTVCEGMKATVSFVTLMMARRKRTLEKTHSEVVEP